MSGNIEKVDSEKLTTVDTVPSSSNDEGDTKDEPAFAPIRTTTSRRPDLERKATEIFNSIPAEERAQLRKLATFHRTQTAAQAPPRSADGADLERKDTIANISYEDPRLNPESPDFDLYIWARVFVRALDEDGITHTKSGYTFKDLSVSGTGSALNLQKNVTDILLAPFRIGEFFSIGQKSPKKILRNFNGCVKSGEMLVVLGRPGSGCK